MAEGSGTTILKLVAESSPLSKSVLLILGLLSIISWSIILYKKWTFWRSARQSASFLDVFRHSNKFSEVRRSAPRSATARSSDCSRPAMRSDRSTPASHAEW